MAKVAKKKQPWEIAGVSRSKYYRDKKLSGEKLGKRVARLAKAAFGPKKPPAKSRKRRNAAVPNGGASTASSGSAGEAWAAVEDGDIFASAVRANEAVLKLRAAADEALVDEFLARTNPAFWGGSLPDRFALTTGTLAALRRKLTDDGDTKG